MLTRCERPAWTDATAAVGAHLRAVGYTPRRVAQALGIIAWNGPDLDGPYWRRSNCADGALGDRVELLVRGGTLPSDHAAAALPGAEAAGILEETATGTRATGTILPLEGDLIWTDRADRAFVGDDGLFLPDSTTLAVRRCLPHENVASHLDIGAGGGAVAVRAARSAARTVALDLNPRAGAGVARTAALSGVQGLEAWTGLAADAPDLGRFDRVSFVLPLLLPWTALAAAPVHTVARSSGLLVELLSVLPALLEHGGLAIFYVQDWTGGPELRASIDHAFGRRSWRGAYWWDHEGSTAVGPIRAGILAIRADASPGWVDARCEAKDVGVDDWWPELAHLLGEGGCTTSS